MSVTLGGNGSPTDAGDISPEFAGKTFEEFKKFVTKQFHATYGRYENNSGTLFFEVYHSETAPDGYPDETGVRWRKGLVGKEDEAEDEVIMVPTAITRYADIVGRGYTRIFKGVTEGDMENGRERLRVQMSAPAREGLLGTYRRGDSFVRVSEYKKGEYSLERGCGLIVNEGRHGLNETEFRGALAAILDEGFSMDGDGAAVSADIGSALDFLSGAMGGK